MNRFKRGMLKTENSLEPGNLQASGSSEMCHRMGIMLLPEAGPFTERKSSRFGRRWTKRKLERSRNLEADFSEWRSLTPKDSSLFLAATTVQEEISVFGLSMIPM